VAAKKKAAMPKWQPAPQEWIDAFDAALPKEIKRKKRARRNCASDSSGMTRSDPPPARACPHCKRELRGPGLISVRGASRFRNLRSLLVTSVR
jgi:hypothetical protein